MKPQWLSSFVLPMFAWVRKATGFLLVFAACTTTAIAGPAAPEIDSGTASSAVALLAGGTLLLKSRITKK
jgi:hypothetical protein